MPRFAANLSLLYADLPFLERFAAAAACGFGAVEYQFPYAQDRRDLAAAARDAKLPVILHNTPPGDFEKGERGLGCLHGRQAEFRDQVVQAIDDAIRRIRKTGKAAGILTGHVEDAKEFIAGGANFCAVGNDTGLLVAASSNLVKTFKG